MPSITRHEKCGYSLIATPDPEYGYCLHCYVDVYIGRVVHLEPPRLCDLCGRVKVKDEYPWYCRRCTEKVRKEEAAIDG